MARKRMLIYGSEAAEVAELRKWLSPLNLDLEPVEATEPGRDPAAPEPWPLVLVDLDGTADGAQVIRAIREHHSPTLILVASAGTDPERLIEAMHAQVFDFLRKPYRKSEVTRIMEASAHELDWRRLAMDTPAMMVHDIKIPLTSIIGFASLLYDRGNGRFHSRARRFADKIVVNGQRMLEMIENYLTTCRIECPTWAFQPVPVDLVALVTEVVEVAQYDLARHHDLVLELPKSRLPEIPVDEMLLYRAVNNLINNALKYSPPQTRILVRVIHESGLASPDSGGAIAIEVENPAPLLTPQDLEGVFDRFMRGRTDGPSTGEGLGLFVVSLIARLHGGKATVRLDHGRVLFAIRLPLGTDAPHLYAEPDQ